MPELLASLAFMAIIGALLIVFIQAIATAIHRWQTIFDDPDHRAALIGFVIILGTTLILWSLTMMPIAFGLAH